MNRDYKTPAGAAPPDWRGLCEELADEVEAYARDRDDEFPECLDRARALLAQPEPEAWPTDEQLLEVWWREEGWEPGESWDALRFARAVLARWGRPAPVPAGERQAAPVPVAVSERLPQPEDCDAEGRCWWWCVSQDGIGDWFQRRAHLSAPNFARIGITHWLPAHALPLPSGEVEHG